MIYNNNYHIFIRLILQIYINKHYNRYIITHTDLFLGSTTSEEVSVNDNFKP